MFGIHGFGTAYFGQGFSEGVVVTPPTIQATADVIVMAWADDIVVLAPPDDLTVIAPADQTDVVL